MRWHIWRFVYYNYVPVTVNYFERERHGNERSIELLLGVLVIEAELIAERHDAADSGMLAVKKNAVRSLLQKGDGGRRKGKLSSKNIKDALAVLLLVYCQFHDLTASLLIILSHFWARIKEE